MNPARKILNALTERASAKLWTQMRSVLDATAVAGSGGVLFFGDSITILGRWEMMFPGLRTANFGIPGETSAHLLQRLEPVIRVRPSKLFLMIGTNDLSRGVTVPEIAGNVAAILQRLRSELPGCRVYLQTALPRNRKYSERLRALNARYTEIARAHGAVLVDLFPLFDDGSGQIRAEFSNDELHLLGPGYLVWRDAIASHVLDA